MTRPAESGTPTEIVAVGRELLTGHTVDTNSAWLAARLPALGGRVTRIVVVDDDPAEIVREITGARERGGALVITTGGLGPTFDDRTLVGVAAVLGVALVEHSAALAFVEQRYRELAEAGAVADGALSPPRRKMAALPEGAQPIDNPVGSAPGVFACDAHLAILSLPGVPAEMHALFDAAAGHIRARLGTPRHTATREIASGLGDESLITLAAERVMAALPGVHVKSLPTAFAPDADLRVRVTATGTDPADTEARVAQALRALETALAAVRPS